MSTRMIRCEVDPVFEKGTSVMIEPTPVEITPDALIPRTVHLVKGQHTMVPVTNVFDKSIKVRSAKQWVK